MQPEIRDNQGVQLARRGFLRLISASVAALAVFRSLPVQAAPVSRTYPASYALPRRPSQTGIITDIQEPDIWITPEELSALEDLHTADQRWMTRDGGFRFGPTPYGPTYRERRP